MRIYLGLIAMALVLTSCGGKKGQKKSPATAAPFVVTDNEKAGIKEAVDFYGGQCNFTIPIIQPGNLRTARLEITKSAALEQAAKISELNLSNIALIFYRNLKDESKNFDQVQVSVSFSDSKSVERSFAIPVLATVVNKSPIVTKIVDLIKDQNYDGLAHMLNDDNGITHFDKKKLIYTIKATDSAIGKVQSFVPYGFLIIKSDEGKDILHMSGLMQRTKNNNEFSVDIDPASDKDEAIFINYKL